jgi:hypothetical protein
MAEAATAAPPHATNARPGVVSRPSLIPLRLVGLASDRAVTHARHLTAFRGNSWEFHGY